MSHYEKLYDEQENVKVRFVGFTTNDFRYDFGIVYTNMFFGKPMIICMQTGRSTLLDSVDLKNIEHLQQVFRIDSRNNAVELASFFEEMLPSISLLEQYE